MSLRRNVLATLVLVTLSIGGIPFGGARAQDGSFLEKPAPVPRDELVQAAFSPIESDGDWGPASVYDSLAFPGVGCFNTATTGPKSVTIAVVGPDMYANNIYHSVYPNDTQPVAWYFDVYQSTPDGSSVTLVASSTLQTGNAGFIAPFVFDENSVSNLPLGPRYTVAVRLYWYDLDADPVTGYYSYVADYYLPVTQKDSGTTTGAVTNACKSPFKALAKTGAPSGPVGFRLTFELSYFPITVPVKVYLDGVKITSLTTTPGGTGVGNLKIPETVIGSHTFTWTSGLLSASKSFTVVPKLAVSPISATRGTQLKVTLTGFAANETVPITWLKNGVYSPTGRSAVTNAKGSATVSIYVPRSAPLGTNSIGAFGPVGQATTAITVVATAVTAAEKLSTSTPTASATVQPTATPTIEPTATPTIEPTATAEPTLEPTATPEPTVAPEATTEPTPEPTLEPTLEPTATTEPVVEPPVGAEATSESGA